MEENKAKYAAHAAKQLSLIERTMLQEKKEKAKVINLKKEFNICCNNKL